MDSTVIVALPAVDEKVMRISSEQVPHLTLVFMPPASSIDNLEELTLYVKHAAEQLSPFYLTVDYRGELGEDSADVLFFEDNSWDLKRVKEFRHHLLLNDVIKRAYDSVEQFPEWTPHLTLGYPETPAKEDDSDYPGIHSVRFDRIAVFTGDYEGPEFRLKYDETAMEVAMSDLSTEDRGAAAVAELFHFGVKGMKWGVRKSDVASAGGAPKERGKVKRALTKANVATDAGAKVINEGEKKLIFLPQKNRDDAAAATQAQVLGAAAAINKKPAYKGKDLKADPALKEAYFKEVEAAAKKIYADELHIARTEAWADFLGTKVDTTGMRIQAASDRIKHADDGMETLLVLNWELDELGQIVGVNVPPEFLAHTEDLNLELKHYGVKGMKWGVRNDPGHEGERVKNKKLPKLDQKWEKGIYTTQGAIKVHNAMAEHFNSRIGAINDRHPDANIFDAPDSDASKAYMAEVTKLENDAYAVAVTAVHGKSPSGSKKAVFVSDEKGDRIEVRNSDEVQHAEDTEPDLVLLVTRSGGHIGSVKMADTEVAHADEHEAFLAHYGVKGMKWGVRKDDKTSKGGASSGPTSVVVTQKKPGKFAKTEGGKGHPLHEDAERALVARQKAKSSTTDSLSNQELRSAIERMQLEQKYSQLEFGSDRRSRGARFIAGLFGQKKPTKFRDMDEEYGEKTRDAVEKAFAARAAAKAAKAAA